MVSVTGSVCALTFNGDVYCWGANDTGQVGNADDKGGDIQHPKKIALSISIRDISSSGGHICALSRNNYIYCWGYNGSHEVSSSNKDSVFRPVKVPLPGPSVTVKTGSYSSCPILKNKKIYCWGSNYYGILDPNDSASKFSYPRQILLNKYVLDFKITLGYLCYINNEGKVFCRGEGTDNASINNSDNFIEIPLPSFALNFFETSYLFYVALKNNTVQCWDAYRLDSTDMRKQRIESSNGVYADVFPFNSDSNAVSGNGFCTLINSKIKCKNELSSSLSDYANKLHNILSATIMPDHDNDYACAVTKFGDLYCWRRVGLIPILPKESTNGELIHLGGPKKK